MTNKFLFIFFPMILLTSINLSANVVPPEELICGKWESSEKNLVVQVYKENNKFKAEIIWFNPGGGKTMEECVDLHNPDVSLRCRKVLGMSVLVDMCYKSNTNSWEDGTIYDAKNGRQWNASINIDKDGSLKVKGYWHFKFIGRTLTFRRV
jgi:uncharacterized protein (DUF2147 family)